MAEGELIFPNEPLIRVHGSLVEAQLLETVLLNVRNFQTLIATKTARIVEAANGKNILEFGLRRAQGFNGALSATRASFIGGAYGTSNVLAGKLFGIPVQGTMAHSWVMAFETEEEAFAKYAELYPETTVILVDTFNTIKNGLPDAINILKELKGKKIKNFGIRLDSGDFEYLSKTARSMLDDEGLNEAKIIVSNELDENIIEELVNKKSPIDVFGVGYNLVTGKDDPALTGVYKLCSISKDNKFMPCLKISDDPRKTTNPDIKNILRFYKNNEMLADLIVLENEKDIILEKIKFKRPIEFRHPDYEHKFFILNEYDEIKILLNKVIEKGKLISPNPKIYDIKNNSKINMKKINPTYKRLLNPHVYKVSISEKLMLLKLDMIKKFNLGVNEDDKTEL